MRLPMSPSEVWVMIASIIIASVLWGLWYVATAALWPPRRRPAGRVVLWIAPPLAAALILTVLTTVASHDVIDDKRYITMYFALGMAWVALGARAFPALGLHLRDDVVERRNPAAAPAMGGGIIGLASAYAGANVGDGPGWWIVIAAATIATAALLLAWQALETLSRIAESVTVERDVAAGWRLGGFLVAAGLVCGRAVAGDWVSAAAMLRDATRTGWPLAVLVALAAMLERGLRVSPSTPARNPAVHGWTVALLMIVSAAGWLATLGLPR